MTVGSRGVRGRLVRVLAVTVTGAAALGGCTGQPGAAAVVDGERITVGALQDATAELAPYLQDASPSSVLLLLVAEPTFEQVAQENGIVVPDDQARAVLDGLAAGGDGTAPAGDGDFSPASLEVARFTLLQQRLQEQENGADLLAEATERLADADVEINPRYGDVDFAAGTGITPVERPWLVPAAATP